MPANLTVMVLLALASPNVPQDKPPPAEPAKSAPRFDANGWPLVTPTVQPVRSARSDFETAPHAAPATPPPAGMPVRTAGERPHVEAPPASAPMPAPAATQGGRTPLAELFGQVGHPSALQDLKGVVARMQVRLFDPTGVEQYCYEVFHEADLGTRDRDRLVFTEGRKIYGRDGATVWARQSGMLWPSKEPEARDELELHGLLLRMPWAFADSERFVAGPRETLQLEGRPIVRWRIEGRAADATPVMGPSAVLAPVPRFELDGHADSNEPFELRYTLPASGIARRVRLQDWRAFGSVRIPMKRMWLDHEGKKTLEVEVVRLDVGQALPAGQFSPETRR